VLAGWAGSVAHLEGVTIAVEDGGHGAVAQVDHGLHRQVLKPHLHRRGRDVGPARNAASNLHAVS